jgi:hypothetical protein
MRGNESWNDRARDETPSRVEGAGASRTPGRCNTYRPGSRLGERRVRR